MKSMQHNQLNLLGLDCESSPAISKACAVSSKYAKCMGIPQVLDIIRGRL